jgi:CheY-like chemotaxis protein
VERQQYDVVLMDVQMPEMDGLDSTRRIRGNANLGKQPRIIAMTANALEGDRETCLAAGMDDYIVKPVQLDQLVESLKKCAVSVAVTEGAPPEPAPEKAKEKAGRAHREPTPRGDAKAVAAVLDPAAFDRLRAALGSKASSMLPTLIDNFCRDGQRLMVEARRALDRMQAVDLRRAAHTMKSTGATFGATSLAAVARDLERLAKDGSLEGASGLVEQMEGEFGRACRVLDMKRKEF